MNQRNIRRTRGASSQVNTTKKLKGIESDTSCSSSHVGYTTRTNYPQILNDAIVIANKIIQNQHFRVQLLSILDLSRLPERMVDTTLNALKEIKFKCCFRVLDNGRLVSPEDTNTDLEAFAGTPRLSEGKSFEKVIYIDSLIIQRALLLDRKIQSQDLEYKRLACFLSGVIIHETAHVALRLCGKKHTPQRVIFTNLPEKLENADGGMAFEFSLFAGNYIGIIYSSKVNWSDQNQTKVTQVIFHNKDYKPKDQIKYLKDQEIVDIFELNKSFLDIEIFNLPKRPLKEGEVVAKILDPGYKTKVVRESALPMRRLAQDERLARVLCCRDIICSQEKSSK
jgi:hypothetical protein